MHAHKIAHNLDMKHLMCYEDDVHKKIKDML